MVYAKGFKSQMVKRMVGPEGIPAAALAREVGLSQPTLSRWLRDARRLGGMNDEEAVDGAGDRPAGEAKVRKGGKRSVQEKLRLIGEAASLSEDELGLFLRRHGLHEATLRSWEQAATSGLSESAAARSGRQSSEAKKIAGLERELRRKEKALAEMAALITLKKRAQEIWGAEDDDTDTRSAT